MKKTEVKIRPFSTENDYFVIDNKGCFTCLVPVEQSEKFKTIFEACNTNEEILQVIENIKNIDFAVAQLL